MPPETIRTLPFGTGLILLRSASPIIARLRAWTNRADARNLRVGRVEIESLLREPAPVADPVPDGEPGPAGAETAE